jgi:hypothetical protein
MSSVWCNWPQKFENLFKFENYGMHFVQGVSKNYLDLSHTVHYMFNRIITYDKLLVFLLKMIFQGLFAIDTFARIIFKKLNLFQI